MYISRLERDGHALELSPGRMPNSDRRVVSGPWVLPKEKFGSGSVALVLRGWGPREIRLRRSWWVRLKEPASAILERIALWHQRATSRQALLELDDRSLRDIGLDRASAHYQGSLPFWRGD